MARIRSKWALTLCALVFVLIGRLVVLEFENRSLGERLEGLGSDVRQIRRYVNLLASSNAQLRLVANLQPQGEGRKAAFVATAPVQEPREDHYPASDAKSEIERLRKESQRVLHQTERLEQSFEQISTKLWEDMDLRNHTPSTSPVEPSKAWISSWFGRRRDPFTDRAHVHLGLDISADPGTSVTATADGMVAARERDAYFGNHILIEHRYGLQTLYGHLRGFAVERGDNVFRGQVIGYVGMTGRATAPHVHYGIRKNDRWVDPVPYFLQRDGLNAQQVYAASLR